MSKDSAKLGWSHVQDYHDSAVVDYHFKLAAQVNVTKSC